METIIIFGIGVIAGLAVGFFLWKNNSGGPFSNQIKDLEIRNARLEEEKKSRDETIETFKKSEQENENKIKIFKESIKTEFENLSQKIFDQKSSQFKKDSKDQLLDVLGPLKEKIKDFESKVEKHYGDEAKERFSLREEIKRLSQLNERMNEETEHLTQALKGDVRSQGVWGEVILNRILEASGLRKGEEYTIQGQGMKLKSEENTHLKPDVIVHLPEKKNLIIDAKVSLTHYLEWTKAESAEDQARYLKLFVQSVNEHVKRLSSKNYASADRQSVDFVFLFFPMESAFSVALQNDAKISSVAWESSVVIVSPTTLLATLRTVNFMWQRDRENKNAFEIAEKAGRMHDKFAGFVEDLKSVGDHLDKSRDSYDSAYKKLATGKGNLLSRMDEIQKLGARTHKKLPPPS